MKPHTRFRRGLFAALLALMLLMTSAGISLAQTNTLTRCKIHPETGQEVCITYTKSTPTRPEVKTPNGEVKSQQVRSSRAAKQIQRFQTRSFRFGREISHNVSHEVSHASLRLRLADLAAGLEV